MIPYKTIIKLDKDTKQALYLQVANQFIELIKKGMIAPKTKLPSSRLLAETLQVHRRTIVAAYDELILQGWVETIPKKGTFVHRDLPILKQKALGSLSKGVHKERIGFSFNKEPGIDFPVFDKKENFLYINDGTPDARLAPLPEIAKIYRRIAAKKRSIPYATYHSTYGNPELRQALAQYLNQTRGLRCTKDNVMITRGSQMGIYLLSQLLLQEKEYIIVGETNYIAANITFLNRGAQLLRIPVDHNGIVTEAVEELCKKHPVKAIFVTPHHHHPTTVTLSAERRLHLLNLSQTYGFAIIEDDYDYDFNYSHAPILPLASHDKNGNVIYIGSVCKAVAPVYRIGYLVAPKPFVDECAKLRRFIDRQGDSLLEYAFAYFIKEGGMERHLKKTLKIYKKRRDLFCTLLKTELKDYFNFEIPKGGMAIWAVLNAKYKWEDLVVLAEKHELEIGNWQRYDSAKIGHNGIRFGFAAYNEEEIHEVIHRLKQSCLGLL
ncbi:PLP-dependent aminotransferase family protein [Galbibacter pacificus]|uniref:PLP-dependent aminotransferase family protein n=1 Tax=Galbibacter pacificus TaxID=2996052 RepID=A0ABT6FPC9_9FLAO|nr:PLP-dependent aminotransferase family protein [Galbibacter pacificus]MDG3581635.1 PLP-dependent aminotransferase family protein [Galbibacter pacificus]MDG3585113.1 PLP-dependent aminotransferase family protein [Galbibacter pacificus]